MYYMNGKKYTRIPCFVSFFVYYSAGEGDIQAYRWTDIIAKVGSSYASNC